MTHRRVGLIVVGKSWLVNLIIGEDRFEHKFAPSSVTKETEFEEKLVALNTGETVSAAIFNIPGLIENDQEAIDRNKVEIQKAFEQRSTSVIVFVVSTAGGQVWDEDVVAFKALNDAYQLKQESLCIVVNQLKKKRPTDYEGKTTLRLESLFGISPLCVTFINEVDDDDEEGLQVALASLQMDAYLASMFGTTRYSCRPTRSRRQRRQPRSCRGSWMRCGAPCRQR
eukprot:TRINITY_DN17736_c0_g1_i4.p1 TRINITY_DN17736_c0_g1~~TRINITY_DN17736_c0_g1_i4.p1  ORF type:complete len:236 (+),score=60.64 TRINITY_DN17736_c0_g1_i4:33-710(+)